MAVVAKIIAITDDRSSLSPFVLLEIKIRSIPIKSPRANAPTISIKGNIIKLAIETVAALLIKVDAIEVEIPKAIIQTASSIATTGNKVSTKGPLALYCLTTIKVAAGAVAEPIAPYYKTKEKWLLKY